MNLVDLSLEMDFWYNCVIWGYFFDCVYNGSFVRFYKEKDFEMEKLIMVCFEKLKIINMLCEVDICGNIVYF